MCLNVRYTKWTLKDKVFNVYLWKVKYLAVNVDRAYRFPDIKTITIYNDVKPVKPRKGYSLYIYLSILTYREYSSTFYHTFI